MNPGAGFDLTGRVAIVTGAAGLLGRRHCAALADAGATVVAADLSDVDGFESTVAVDITDPVSLEAARDYVLSAHGRIDVLVNNAAINDMVEHAAEDVEAGRFEVFPLDVWRRVLDVNITGTFLASQVLGAVMAEAGSGSIVNVASTYGVNGPDQRLYLRPDGTRALWKSPAYPTTKGAVIAFTRYLAAYWGDRGVRVNTLTPGGVENGQEGWFVDAYAERTMLGRMAAPDDYRGALVFLASDASAYMTGTNLVVDGGWTAW